MKKPLGVSKEGRPYRFIIFSVTDFYILALEKESPTFLCHLQSKIQNRESL